MKLRIIALAALLALLTGCRAPVAIPQEVIADTRWVNVYYAAAEAGVRGAVIAAEPCEISQGDLEHTVREIYRQSLREPISNSLRSAIPEDTVLESAVVKNGTAILNLSREYGKISGFTRTVADYCIAMSLCELEGIRDVTILVAGDMAQDSVKLNPDDIVLADLDLVGFRKKLKLYFPDRTNSILEIEMRDTVTNGGEQEALLVAKALVDGPTKRGLASAVPYGTQVNSVQMVNGVCILDLSAEFIENHPRNEAWERMCIRSVVESLSEIEGVENVLITVEGSRTRGFEFFDLSHPFSKGNIQAIK